MQRYIDLCAVPCQNFINGVINDLFKEVMQSTKTGVANIHSGALADSFKTFKNPSCNSQKPITRVAVACGGWPE